MGIWRNIKRLATSKKAIGALLFAFALWGYTRLNEEFVVYLTIPLNITMPDTRAIENPVIDSISVEVNGTGWKLFYLTFFSSSAKCDVNLDINQLQDTVFTVSRDEMIKSIDYLSSVSVVDVYPSSINLKTGVIERVKVPVRSLVSVVPRQGFAAVGEIKLKPDSIYISGNRKLLGNLFEWKTKQIVINDVFGQVSLSVALSDTLSSIIKLSRNVVTAEIDIQQIAEKTIYDVEVNIRSGKPPESHKLFPRYVDVTVRGGVELLTTITKSDFSVTIDQEQVLNDSTGIIRPSISINKEVDILKTDPPYVYHLKQYSKRSLAEL